MSSTDDTLYNLLPAVYRMRDALEPGQPLQALLRAISGQVDALAGDIAQEYDNWFIETCAADRVTYFAQLVGLSLGPELPGGAAGSIDAVWRRRQVADAVADRRRKGTFSVLEELAAEATGWPAVAIEVGDRVLGTQSIRFPDVGRRRLLDLRDGDALDALVTPLSDAAPLPDVRRLSSHRTPGTVNPESVAVWLWRLQADAVVRAPADSADEEGRYTFDQLGRDLGLVVITSAGDSPSPASALDVATPITRRELARRPESYYGQGRSLCVFRGGRPIPRSEIEVGDLRRWRARPRPRHVMIDPELGRIAFPERHAPEEEITVSCAHLGMCTIGGGHYERPLAAADGPVYRVARGRSGVHRSIDGAIKAWRRANRDGESAAAVIEIADDGVYQEHFDLRLAAGERLEIRAAQGRRPILVPVESGGGLLDRLRIRGVDETTAQDPGVALPSLTLDGIWVARHMIDLDGAFASVTLRHCTLVPSAALRETETEREREAPSLVVHGARCPITISRSILGRIRVETPESGLDPLPLEVSDSVLDASDLRRRAVFGPDERPAWVVLSLSRVTVLGGAEVHSVRFVEDTLLTAPLDCERRQTGDVRFSYVPPGSRTPRRISCQPDLVLARGEAGVLEAERTRPQFDAVRFGAPAYARLAADSAAELVTGAHDEGELGVYHDLWESQRAADLRARLREFAPVGTDIDIRFAT